MKIKSVYTTEKAVKDAVAEIKKQLTGFDTKMLIFFASAGYDPEKVSEEIHKALHEATTIGCSSAYEFTNKAFNQDSIVAMAFSAEAIADVKVEVVEGIKGGKSISKAFSSFEEYYGQPMSKMDYKQYIGIMMTDGLSKAEEAIMDEIGDLTNVTFIGGSASDKLTFTGTYVYCNGKAYTDAVAFALVKPGVEFDIIKTQSFDVLEKALTATDTDPANRTVGKFNGQDAIKAYADAIGVSIEEAQSIFMEYTVGVVALDDIFVRSPMSNDRKSMSFYSSIPEGMDLKLLKSSDIIKDTTQAVDSMKKKLGGLSGVIDFHCVLRTLHLTNVNQMQEYINIFADVPTIGFSTYGEQYIGHVNQTSTMLVFK